MYEWYNIVMDVFLTTLSWSVCMVFVLSGRVFTCEKPRCFRCFTLMIVFRSYTSGAELLWMFFWWHFFSACVWFLYCMWYMPGRILTCKKPRCFWWFSLMIVLSGTKLLWVFFYFKKYTTKNCGGTRKKKYDERGFPQGVDTTKLAFGEFRRIYN